VIDLFSARDSDKKDEVSTADSWLERQEKESLFDWNVLMKDVVDGGKPGKDLNATLVKDLLEKHYQNLKQSNV
jgi:hypothetical protein